MKKLSLLVLVLCLALAVACVACAESTDMTIESRGVQVPATLVTPDGVDEYPIVMLIHGHGGSRDECYGYPDVAAGLAEKGIASLRIDFPGCGDSTESFQQNTLTNMKADVLAALDWAKANLPVTKVGLFGYSMGGRITLELIADGFVPDAAAMLAPAADTHLGFAGMFELYDDAKANGYTVYTTVYGQVQELSAAWFDDLLVYETIDSLLDAVKANIGTTPTMVIWGQDDSVVSPDTSAAVAEALGSETIDATGNDHSYSFYTTEAPELRELIVNGVADFFAANLK